MPPATRGPAPPSPCRPVPRLSRAAGPPDRFLAARRPAPHAPGPTPDSPHRLPPAAGSPGSGAPSSRAPARKVSHGHDHPAPPRRRPAPAMARRRGALPPRRRGPRHRQGPRRPDRRRRPHRRLPGLRQPAAHRPGALAKPHRPGHRARLALLGLRPRLDHHRCGERRRRPALSRRHDGQARHPLWLAPAAGRALRGHRPAPSENGGMQYRIRSPDESFERIAGEAELEPVPGRGA